MPQIPNFYRDRKFLALEFTLYTDFKNTLRFSMRFSKFSVKISTFGLAEIALCRRQFLSSQKYEIRSSIFLAGDFRSKVKNHMVKNTR